MKGVNKNPTGQRHSLVSCPPEFHSSFFVLQLLQHVSCGLFYVLFFVLKKAEDAFAWKWKTCKHFSVRCLQWLPRASWFKFMSSESKQTLQKHTWIFISFTADAQLSNCRNIKSKTTLLHFVNSSEAKTFVSKKTRRSGRQPLGQCDSFSCLHTSRSWTHSISNLSSVLMFLCYRICCGIRIYLCVLGENYETRSPALLVFSEAAPDRWL